MRDRCVYGVTENVVGGRRPTCSLLRCSHQKDNRHPAASEMVLGGMPCPIRRSSSEARECILREPTTVFMPEETETWVQALIPESGGPLESDDDRSLPKTAQMHLLKLFSIDRKGRRSSSELRECILREPTSVFTPKEAETWVQASIPESGGPLESDDGGRYGFHRPRTRASGKKLQRSVVREPCVQRCGSDGVGSRVLAGQAWEGGASPALAQKHLATAPSREKPTSPEVSPTELAGVHRSSPKYPAKADLAKLSQVAVTASGKPSHSPSSRAKISPKGSCTLGARK
ncbi:hypothetical protein KSP40_PGU002762 [Platanthera guangdongensis]|uniref:Uncharacterized protein n=1 Tax=Platanthera guangdongensis TaxID=2320717 RepID=A0ABR2M9N0_9ASPA